MGRRRMATSKKKATAAKAPKRKARPKSKLVQHGDAAKIAAERELLLKTLRAKDWNLSHTAAELVMGNASAVLRALDRYGARAEYEKHKS